MGVTTSSPVDNNGSGSDSDVLMMTREAQGPPCPFFSNYMPPPSIVPPRTLLTINKDGTVVKPQAGCNATVVALKPSPGANPCSSSASESGKKKSSKPARGSALLEDPNVSSCFLIAYDVDERGRVAPTTKASVTVNGAAVTTVDGGGSSTTGKGFNFSTVSSSPSSAHGRNSGDVNTATDQRFGSLPSPHEIASDRDAPTNMPLSTGEDDGELMEPPSPILVGGGGARSWSNSGGGGDGQSPQRQQQLLQRPEMAVLDVLKAAGGSISLQSDNAETDSAKATVTTSAYSMGENRRFSNHAPLMVSPDHSAPSLLSPVRSLHDLPPEKQQEVPLVPSAMRMNASVKSVLVRGRKTGSGTDLGGVHARGEPRRCVATIRVTQQTRWCLFNDSKTHEAHMDLGLCVSLKTALLLRSTSSTKREGNNPGSPTSTRGQNASDCYVRINGGALPLSRFCDLFESDKKTLSEGEATQLEYLRSHKGSEKAKVFHVYLVLAPGAAVAVVQGQIKGYCIDTGMVPHNPKKSLATVGRRYSSEQVDSCRAMAEEDAKKPTGYRHTVKSLVPLAKVADSGDDECDDNWTDDVISVGVRKSRSAYQSKSAEAVARPPSVHVAQLSQGEAPSSAGGERDAPPQERTRSPLRSPNATQEQRLLCSPYEESQRTLAPESLAPLVGLEQGPELESELEQQRAQLQDPLLGEPLPPVRRATSSVLLALSFSGDAMGASGNPSAATPDGRASRLPPRLKDSQTPVIDTNHSLEPGSLPLSSDCAENAKTAEETFVESFHYSGKASRRNTAPVAACGDTSSAGAAHNNRFQWNRAERQRSSMNSSFGGGSGFHSPLLSAAGNSPVSGDSLRMGSISF